MIKQLFASALLAAAFVAPVNAEPVRCWIDAENEASVPQQVCDASVRTNANGHRVIDLTDSRGTTINIVLWFNRDKSPLYAEVFMPSGRQIWGWEVDHEGDIHLFHKPSGAEVWFSIPQSNAAPRTFNT